MKNLKTYSEVKKEGLMTDLSGCQDPENWMFKKGTHADVWYPVFSKLDNPDNMVTITFKGSLNEMENLRAAINFTDNTTPKELSSSTKGRTFPNGLDNWIETHAEICTLGQTIINNAEDGIYNSENNPIGKAHSINGHFSVLELFAEWTDEFEEMNKGRDWDGEFIEEVEQFVDEKMKQVPREESFWLFGQDACRSFMNGESPFEIKENDFATFYFQKGITTVGDIMDEFDGWMDYSCISKELYEFLNDEGEDGTVDLFLHYKVLPEAVQEAIESFDDDNDLYKECEMLMSKLKPLGYTFEYGVDGVPINLARLELIQNQKQIMFMDGYNEVRTIGNETIFSTKLSKELSAELKRDTIENDVIEKVVAIWNTDGNIDEYLLDEGKCSQEEREIIVEALYDFFTDIED